MSLDVWLTEEVCEPQTVEHFEGNITHNLNTMAREAGLYMFLWRPDELGITKAGELIVPLELGLELLKQAPKRFEKFNSPNGWGMYEHFVPFVEKYLEACKAHPESTIHTSR